KFDEIGRLSRNQPRKQSALSTQHVIREGHIGLGHATLEDYANRSWEPEEKPTVRQPGTPQANGNLLAAFVRILDRHHAELRQRIGRRSRLLWPLFLWG